MFCKPWVLCVVGVFLHVLADTLGSVGVIISSLLIENFGWNIADPICSLFIATMILLSVFPLLRETSTILLLRTPSDLETEIPDVLQKVRKNRIWITSKKLEQRTFSFIIFPSDDFKLVIYNSAVMLWLLNMFHQGFVVLQIMSLDGVLTYRHPHIWNHTSSKIHGTLHVQVSTEVSEQKIVAQVGTCNHLGNRCLNILHLEIDCIKNGNFCYFKSLYMCMCIMFTGNQHIKRTQCVKLSGSGREGDIFLSPVRTRC